MAGYRKIITTGIGPVYAAAVETHLRARFPKSEVERRGSEVWVTAPNRSAAYRAFASARDFRAGWRAQQKSSAA
jgi:hypothetical protein